MGPIPAILVGRCWFTFGVPHARCETGSISGFRTRRGERARQRLPTGNGEHSQPIRGPSVGRSGVRMVENLLRLANPPVTLGRDKMMERRWSAEQIALAE